MINMKKILSLVVLLVATLFVTTVKAEEIKTVDVTVNDLSVTVAGTTDDTVAAVSITIFDKDGELVLIKSVSVDDDSKYTLTVTLEKGTYDIKVADYSGGDFITKEKVVVGETAKNPKTGDLVELYCIVFAFCIAALTLACAYPKFLKKSKKTTASTVKKTTTKKTSTPKKTTNKKTSKK